ncbi:hypothetical protein CLAFUW4_12858 [Fulvia fulva]|nr:hypothetical protein CLAFUR4_12862 [Fulvia fulva]WPV21654.1 hypothetical protein CLAFUW4_12858 [Fulvia fulva]
MSMHGLFMSWLAICRIVCQLCDAFINTPLLLLSDSSHASSRGLTALITSFFLEVLPPSPSFIRPTPHSHLHTCWCGLFDNHIWRLCGFSMSSSRGNGPFFVHIENLPDRYTWQDLKDMIRRRAAHGVWTDMAVLPNGQPGGKGYARIQRSNEASDLYKYLTQNIIEGRRLRVHLWDTSEIPANFITCNCNNTQIHPSGQQIAQWVAQPGWQTFSATSPISMAQPALYPPPSTMPTMMPPSVQQPPMQWSADQLTLAMSRVGLDPRNPADVHQYTRQVWSVRQAPQQQYQAQGGAQQYPRYMANSTGLPTNTSQGVIRTEARGIFISGLNFKACTRDIELHFGEAGEVVKVDLQKDPQGKSKGNATIQYASAEAAQRAIEMFHGERFQNMRMNVRRDKEATAINAPQPTGTGQSAARRTEQPTIVNGSQVRQAMRA